MPKYAQHSSQRMSTRLIALLDLIELQHSVIQDVVKTHGYKGGTPVQALKAYDDFNKE